MGTRSARAEVLDLSFCPSQRFRRPSGSYREVATLETDRITSWIREKREYLTTVRSSVLYEVRILVDLEIVTSRRSRRGRVVILRITPSFKTPSTREL